MKWKCYGCGHVGDIQDTADPSKGFYLKGMDGVFDYRCPNCKTTDNDKLYIPRLDVTPPGQPLIRFYIPTPKQILLHLAMARNVLWGGRAGTGKSHGLRMDAYMRCLTVPGYRVLMLRRQFTELKDTHLDKALYEADTLGARWRAADYTVVFKNGSRLRFGHCETDAAVSQYLSSEFDCIIYDEGSTFTEYSVRFINSRLRTAKEGVTPIVRIGSNPGAMWLYRYYIAKDVTADDDPSYVVSDYDFIPAEMADNPHVNLAEQQLRLNSLPSEALRKMYRDGDWLSVEGQFFTDWTPKDRETAKGWHVIDSLPTFGDVAFEDVPWIEWVRAIDWGYSPDPGVCLWIACLPNNRFIVFKEFTFRELVPKAAAKKIKEMTGDHKVRYTVAGHDCWMGSRDTGESIQETFARNGLPLRVADTNRVNGWSRVHSTLQEISNDGTGQVPQIQVYRHGCPGLVRTLPMLRNNPRDPGDIMQESDHWADALRYFVMSRPAGHRAKRQTNEVWERLPKEVRRSIMGGARAPLGSENIRRAR